MKPKTKALLLSFCAVLLVSAFMVGTLAYLTSTTNAVNNTFTVGSVKISLDEAKVDLDGTPVQGASRVTENNYKLIPGHTYTKDPQVHIETGSEPCYVRMLVTISKFDALSALYDDNWTPTKWDMIAGVGWDYYGDGFSVDNDAKTATFEFRCDTVQNPGDMPALFNSFTVNGELSSDQISTLEGMEITVEAEAIQADGFDNATDAFTALDGTKN